MYYAIIYANDNIKIVNSTSEVFSGINDTGDTVLVSNSPFSVIVECYFPDTNEWEKMFVNAENACDFREEFEYVV